MVDRIKAFTIQQVSQRVGLTAHTLRFWEKELPAAFTPLRTKGGQRRYTMEHLFIIEEIKALKRKGLSLAEIRENLDNRQRENSNSSKSKVVDRLADSIAETVKIAVYNFFGNKTPE